jgi:hypothetical protein
VNSRDVKNIEERAVCITLKIVVVSINDNLKISLKKDIGWDELNIIFLRKMLDIPTFFFSELVPT